MLTVGTKRCVGSMLRDLGVGANSRSKFLLIILASIILGFCFLGMKLSEIHELQKKQLMQCSHQQSKLSMPPQTLSNQATKNTGSQLKYWLWHTNPESPHMQHVRNAFRMLGYEMWDQKTGTWDVMWAYEYPFPVRIKPEDIKPNQLINHYPGLGYLTSKVFLAKSKFKYIPMAFELPQDKDKFHQHANSHPDKLWVQKSNNHRGITIKGANELDLKASNTFVQEFISDPFLIDGRKFDIGVYAIITSVNPLRLYVYDGDWLFRYCPEDYMPLDVKNPRKYVVEDEYTPTWEMPSLRDYYVRLRLSHQQTFLAHIRKQGHDPATFRRRLYDAVAEMTFEKQPDFIRALQKYPTGSSTFFEMVRFDFVLDSRLSIFLMEVNMSPNLSSAHFSDNALLYEQVMRNTLSVAGVAAKTLHTDGKMHPGVLASDQDIQVYEKECAECHKCDDEVCQLCSPCITASLRSDLKRAFSEHVNRLRCARVFPKPLGSQQSAKTHSAVGKLNDKDRLMDLWYRGMCLKSVEWCT